MFHHVEHKYVTKQSESFRASQWNRFENILLQYRFKNVLRNSYWNIIYLDTMYEFCWMQIQNDV